MSAADEYRLLALTLSTREIVKDLDIPEDIRCVLLWLEERGYGDVVDHVDDAMAMGYWHNGKRVWPIKTIRFEWLLRYTSVQGPQHITWPRELMTDTCLTGDTLFAFTESHLADHANTGKERVLNALVADAWGHMLKAIREHTKPHLAFNEDPQDTAARSVWNVFEVLNRIHKHGYPIFVSGFFRQFAFAGHNDVALAGRLLPPLGAETKELRWKQ